jgi:hypothetical protein
MWYITVMKEISIQNLLSEYIVGAFRIYFVLWYSNGTMLCRYVHSYQSYLWNHAASMRVEKYGKSTCALDSAALVQAVVLKLTFGILFFFFERENLWLSRE